MSKQNTEGSSASLTSRERSPVSQSNHILNQQSKLFDDDMYDDACDLGKFFMNPCLFLITAVLRIWRRCQARNSDPVAGTSLHTGRSHLASNKKIDKFLPWQQVLYLVAVFGSWSVVFLQVYPLARLSTEISPWHMKNGYAIFLLSVFTWRYACGTSPGDISDHTMQKFDNYPFDHLLYHPNKMCPTLNIRKLPRSKYDRHTGRQVPRFDHFCGWLNVSIGEENYRYFMLFLIAHTFMTLYGTIMMILLLLEEAAVEVGQLQATFLQRMIGVVTVLFSNHKLTFATVFLFMTGMSITLVMFLSFHLYIISRGMTTNEYFKWKAWNQWYEKAIQTYEQGIKDGKHSTSNGQRHRGGFNAISDMSDVTCTGATDIPMNQEVLSKEGDETDEEENHETTVINPGPKRTNVYDKGVFSNFREVLFPLSLRKEKIPQNMKTK
mmetsp:Transcript_26640/g.48352  ORF Transcript_26640/g.48352 Transcript_26640/m.48352 type:complete len:437 (-) Transcript_26640:404-1714(-)